MAAPDVPRESTSTNTHGGFQIELGFFSMPLHSPGDDFTKALDDDMEQMTASDGLGYKEAWTGEHFTGEWENIPNAD